MTIPDFQTIMLPFLKFSGDGTPSRKSRTPWHLSSSLLQKRLIHSFPAVNKDLPIGWVGRKLTSKKRDLLIILKEVFLNHSKRG